MAFATRTGTGSAAQNTLVTTADFDLTVPLSGKKEIKVPDLLSASSGSVFTVAKLKTTNTSAENRSKLQEAVTNCPTGGRVIIPAGSFSINDEITLKSSITIEGSGPLTVIEQTVEGKRAFIGTSLTNVTIKDLTLKGPSSTAAFTTGDTFLDITGVNASRSSNITIDNVTVYRAHSGIGVTQADHVKIQNCHVYSFLLFGILASKSASFDISDNLIHNSVQTGAENAYGIMATGDVASGASAQKRCKITGNLIYSIASWDGIMTHECSDLLVSDNIIEDVRTGIDCSTSVGPIDNLIISNNNILLTTTNTWGGTGAIHAGVLVISDVNAGAITDNVVVQGNIIRGPNKMSGYTATGNFYSAIIIEGVRGVNVSNNVIEDIGNVVSGFNGISFFRCPSDIVATGNVMKGTATGYGVRLQNAAAGTTLRVNVSDNIWVPTGEVIGVAFSTGTFTDVVCKGNISPVKRLQWSDILGSTVVNLVDGHGTFVPDIRFGAGNTGITYTRRSGHYKVEGNKVWIHIEAKLSNKGSSTGQLRIYGLPFVAKSDIGYQGLNVFMDNATYSHITAAVQGTLDIVQFYFINSGTLADFTDVNVTNTTLICVTGFYMLGNTT